MALGKKSKCEQACLSLEYDGPLAVEGDTEVKCVEGAHMPPFLHHSKDLQASEVLRSLRR